MKRMLVTVFFMTFWIAVSEFFRNQLVFLSYWQQHYENLGLTFPSKPVNGALWGIWSLLFALGIFFIAKKHSLKETILIAWLFGFIMMWVVIGNLGVLPYKLLWYAVPLSLVESAVAALIAKKLDT